MLGLYDDADLYDLVSPRDEAMERFYVDAVGGHDRKVLELACGSGRLTIPLAKSGAQVTAIDSSPTMLDKALRRAAASAVDVKFVEVDMRDFELDTLFDGVVVAANSLLHLHTAEDFARAFATIRRYLAPGGLLAFDVFVPSAHLLSLPPTERQLLGKFTHPQLGDVSIEETIAYDPITQVSQADWYWSIATQRDFRCTTLYMRQLYPQELPLLLQHNGFQLVSRFGDFDGKPLTAQSLRQVCLCR